MTINRKYIGSSVESLFEEMGELEEVRALAMKKIKAVYNEQTEKAMRDLIHVVESARDRADLRTTEKALSAVLTKMCAYQRRWLKAHK